MARSPLVTEEERQRSLTTSPQSRFQQSEPTGRDWQPLVAFLEHMFQGDAARQPQQQFRMDPTTGAIGMSGQDFPSYDRAPPQARPGQGFSPPPQRGTVQPQYSTDASRMTPMQVLMENINRQQQPQPQQQAQGMPMSLDALMALAGGGGETSMPTFGTGGQVGREHQPLPDFQSPGNVEGFTGGDLTGFLSLPEAVSFDIPQMNPLHRFNLRPEHITSALNTELSYRQAQQAANQQQFSNRMSQLAVAGGMDERAAAAFSQRLVDDQRNTQIQQSQFDLENGLTPMQSLEKQAEMSAMLTKYKHDLDMDKLLSESSLSLRSGKLSDTEKMMGEKAWNMINTLHNSAEMKSLFEAMNEGDMEKILEALQSGSLKMRTVELVQSLIWATDTLMALGQIERRSDVGVPDDTAEKTMTLADYIKQREAQGQR